MEAYYTNEMVNKSLISQFIITFISFTKNMTNLKPDFPTVINRSIPSITKYLRNISPNSKCNTNQGRITFKPDISTSSFVLPP